MQLVRPEVPHLQSYSTALQRHWSPNTTRPQAAQEELALIAANASDYLRWMDDPEGAGPPVTLPDGSRVPRIPGLRRWMWADDADLDHPGIDQGARESQRFIGIVSLRWMADHAPLPPHVLGHVGYSVVPWHSGHGHATAALAALLPLARAHGLPCIELTTDPDNMASQRVIERCGGVFVEAFDKGAAYGHTPGLRFRIEL